MFRVQSPCKDCGGSIEMGQSYYYGGQGAAEGYYHSKCGDPLGIKAAVTAERERCAEEIERLRAACVRAVDILDRNLYRQTEKCEDAVSILRKAINQEAAPSAE